MERTFEIKLETHDTIHSRTIEHALRNFLENIPYVMYVDIKLKLRNTLNQNGYKKKGVR